MSQAGEGTVEEQTAAGDLCGDGWAEDQETSDWATIAKQHGVSEDKNHEACCEQFCFT